jgi:hypothetical protein
MTSPITLPYYTKSAISREKGDGASRDRTGDLLLAKQALSQLSYGPSWAEFTPEEPSSEGRCRVPRSAVPAPALEDYDAAAAERMRGVVAAVCLARVAAAPAASAAPAQWVHLSGHPLRR